jgi:hypothetical protein
MSRGRTVFMKTHDPAVLGFGRPRCLLESINDQNAYSVAITPGTFTEQVGPALAGTQLLAERAHQRLGHGSTRRSSSPTNNVARDEPVDHQQRQRSTTLQLRATSRTRPRQRQRADRAGQRSTTSPPIYPRLTATGSPSPAAASTGR